MTGIVKIIIGATVAVVGYIFADKVVKDTTGQHIHQHLFKWWCELRDCISQWLHNHNNLHLKQVGLTILDRIDNVAVRTKRMMDKVTIGAFATDHRGKIYEIQTTEVSSDEAIKQFPELQNNKFLMQTI